MRELVQAKVLELVQAKVVALVQAKVVELEQEQADSWASGTLLEQV